MTLYSYTSMYTKYNYNHHTLIQVCILNKNTNIELLYMYVYEYNFEYNFEYSFEYNFDYNNFSSNAFNLFSNSI